MRTLMLALVAFCLLSLVVAPAAMAQNGNGDTHSSYKYAWFRDADGDGIPNFLDPDWYAPRDGSGYKDKHQNGQAACPPGAVEQIRTQNTYQYRVENSFQTSTQYQHENRYQYRINTGPNLSEGDQDQDRLRTRDRDGIHLDLRLRQRDRTCQD